MCTATFLRLPEEKRNRILDAAWEEFSTVPFAGASVNQIVRRAGIPRGSFYQYFADKSDLFAYLMDGVRQQVSKYRTVLSETGGDMFAAALRAYDRFIEERKRGRDPLTDRIIRVMEINPKIDMDVFLRDDPEGFFAGTFCGDLETGGLRRRDELFVRLLSRLVFVCLAGAIVDTLKHPERVETNRTELAEALDIIRRGSEKGGQSA